MLNYALEFRGVTWNYRRRYQSGYWSNTV